MLERIIETFSPEWALRRAHFRLVLDQVRAYDAGKIGRRTEGWNTSNGSANAEIGPAAARMRARARDMVRNNPYAASAVAKLAAKCIGPGITPRLAGAPGELADKQHFADRFAAFSDACDPERRLDFYGIEHLAARTVFESGAALIRFLPRPSSFRLRVPLQVQVLEPDYIDAGKTQSIAGGVIIQGVQYDFEGRRVGYWMFDEHPGETLISFVRSGLQSRFVPADQILHVFDPLRPGQVHGVPAFAPAVMRLRDTDDANDAKIMQLKIAACFAAFVKRPNGGAAAPLTASATTGKGNKPVETLQPGTITYLQLDEAVEFANPPAVDGYVEFMTHQLHAIAAGVGVTYQQLTGDLRQTTYSSARVGLIDFWDLLDHWQWHMFVPQLCAPVADRVRRLLVAMGDGDPRNSRRVIWAPPVRRYVNPEVEIGAKIKSIRAGLSTLPQEIAEGGSDPDDQFTEIAGSNAQLDRLGIILDSDPRRVSIGGQAQKPSETVANDARDETGGTKDA